MMKGGRSNVRHDPAHGDSHIPPNYVVDEGVSYVKGCSALDFPFIHDTWPLIYRKISSAISMSLNFTTKSVESQISQPFYSMM